ncbi:CHAT domain-containing protein [Pelomonas sp. UHG3]|uniref:CHAT domain-containing protein n=1 Tax=Roseateles hydrophilus TaxID=2975054 RepID=A0ACC6CBF4_9BURK|nr:CHAT domain-containing protein [Pelomonas sp. UHG3]MCY4745664.1 CHAT domain-containing protein [Pelomonas sp. UHG3]
MDKVLEARAEALFEAGLSAYEAGRVQEAVADWSAALAMFEELIGRGEARFACQRAVMLNLLGLASKTSGALQQAAGYVDQALTAYDELIKADQSQSAYVRVGMLVQLGHWFFGRREVLKAKNYYEQAMVATEGMIKAGQIKGAIERIYELDGLGGLIHGIDELPRMRARYEQAVAACDELIRSGQIQFASDRAGMLIELGRNLSASGELPKAVEHFEQALAAYDELIRPDQTRFAAERAHTLRDLAETLLNSRGGLPQAMDRYRQALTAYEELIRSGQSRLASDCADMLARLGATLCAMRQFHAAAEAHDLALEFGCRALRAEHWHHLVSWVETASIRWRSVWSKAGSTQGTNMLTQLTDLAAQMKQFLRAPGVDDVFGWYSLGPLMELLTSAAPGTPPAQGLDAGALEAYDSVLATALSCVHRASLNSSPEADQTRRANLQRYVAELQHLCAARSANLLAEWFLRSQGLRAQRAAMAGSRDPELQELERRYQALDSLGRTLLGTKGRDDDSRLGGNGHTDSDSRQHVQAPKETMRKERRAYAYALNQVRLFQTELRKRGKLPNETQALELAELRRCLRPRQVLLMLAPDLAKEAANVWAISLLPPSANPEPDAQATALKIPLHCQARLPDLLARVSALAARGGRSVREGPAGRGDSTAVRATSADPEAAANLDHALRQELEQALRPVWQALQQHAVDEVVLVPTGLLHQVPWTRWLADCGIAIRVLPSVGAFVRSCQAPAPQLEVDAALRVAVLGHDATDHNDPRKHLPLVNAEISLSLAQWNQAATASGIRLQSDRAEWQPADAAASTRLLVGMGHGGAAEGNPAHSGLVLAYDEEATPRLFTAYDLPAIHHAHWLLLSCCVLARTDEIMGEPMGMAANAFDFQSRCVMGSLVTVGDLDASLVSLALQWALGRQREALARGSPIEVFNATQAALCAGRWPEGFGAWLQGHLPTALAQAPRQARQANGAGVTLARNLRAAVASMGLPDLGFKSDMDPRHPALLAFAEVLAQRPPASVQVAAAWFVGLGL